MILDYSYLPYPAERNIAIHISTAAERSIRGGHPWLFDGSIQSQSKTGNAGDLAIIFDHKNKFLAVGLYDPDSPIRVRILQHHQPATINQNWFLQALEQAVNRRAPLLTTDTDGYRLVHGENDKLPGLIIDRYADTLVIKLYTAAWFAHLRAVLPALEQVHPAERWVLRLSRGLQSGMTHGLKDGQVIKGPFLKDSSIIFKENGLQFAADVIHGHKTGFFFDQRDNRAWVGKLAKNKNVLDVFSYSGGFSVYAAQGGAQRVLSLDISEPALQSARENLRLNFDDTNVAHCQHDILVADAFSGLQALADSGDQFDLVVVDPPSFAKRQHEVQSALSAYAYLAQLVLQVLESGGTLMMASCSSRIRAAQFYATVHNTAIRAGRPLQEIERTGHALDHPITFTEGAYLKALFAIAS